MIRSGSLALLLVAFLLAGCDLMGSAKKAPPPKTLSHAEFVRRANHICALDLRRTKRLRRPTNPAMFVRELNVAIQSWEKAIAAFRGLTPPSADAAAFRRLLVNVDTEDRLAYKLVEAAKTIDVRHVKNLARRLDAVGKRFRRRSINLGLRTCAKE